MCWKRACLYRSTVVVVFFLTQQHCWVQWPFVAGRFPMSFIIHYLLPPPPGRHTSYHETSYSKREAKLKKEEIFPFMPFKLQARPQIGFPPKCFIQLWQPTNVESRQGQRFIPQATPHAIPLTKPRRSLLSCTILIACQTSKPLFLKQSYMVSIHSSTSCPLSDY